MFTWRMMMLGLVIVQGSSILAMKIAAQPKNLLVCSVELRQHEVEMVKKTAILKISTEQLRKDEKEAQKHMYFAYCGGSTPPELYNNNSCYTMVDTMKPINWLDFPGR